MWLAAAVLFYGCFPKPPLSHPDSVSSLLGPNPPGSVAILPFGNGTDKKEIEEFVRRSFYSHLSVRSYQDVELFRIDSRLRQNGLETPAQYRQTSLHKLGQILSCDAVIFGNVTEFDRIFAGIYSQLSVGAEIEMWDTRTGQRLWQDDHIERSHEGGVPLSLLDVPMIAIRTGLNLTDSVKIETVDGLCRYLAGRLPAPDVELEEVATRYHYLIQVGAFIDSSRAEKLVGDLRLISYPAFIQKFIQNEELWHRVVIGPFESQQETRLVKEKIERELAWKSFVHKVSPSVSSTQ